MSAGLAQPEAGGCSVGHRDGAIEADDLTTFALGLVAEGAQALVANAAGSDRQGGVSLAAVILDFDRLEDAAVGAGDGSVRGAVQAWPGGVVGWQFVLLSPCILLVGRVSPTVT